MEQIGKSEERDSSAVSVPTNELVRNLVEVIYAIQDRSAAYQWPPIQRAIQKGGPVNLTRKGRRAFLLFKRNFKSEVDLRAVEVEVARHIALFRGNKDTKPEKEGLTITEAAQLLNVDRGSLSRHLVEIPLGEAPMLPPGKVPCRRIGNVRRIFREDLFQVTQRKRNQHDDSFAQATSDSAERPNWHRSLSQLFES
jgi:hypothetical protein